jgi:hypothetical protein
VQSLRLELLAEEDSDPPNAFIWVSKKSNVDLDSARVILNKEKNRLLTPEELNNTSEGSGDILLWLPAPSKRELLGALSEGDGKKFVDLLVSQFDLMSRFVPAMDTVFDKCLRKE